MAYKETRLRIQETDSPLSKSSMNQAKLKASKEGKQRFDAYENSKAAKANAKHNKETNYLKDYPRIQFEQRLRQVLNGTATPEITLYVIENLQKFQTPVERTENQTEISVFTFKTQTPDK